MFICGINAVDIIFMRLKYGYKFGFQNGRRRINSRSCMSDPLKIGTRRPSDVCFNSWNSNRSYAYRSRNIIFAQRDKKRIRDLI